MTETEIQKAIIDYLKMRGYKVFRMNAGRASFKAQSLPKGTPDLLAISKYKTIWIEVKTSTGKLSKNQIEMILFLQNCNHKVIVARSIDDLTYFV